LRGHEHGILQVAYSSDGGRIIANCYDLTARVWDAETGACLESVRGLYDVAAIAAGLPWWAIARGPETAIEPAGGGHPIALFPIVPYPIANHPNGRTWAGHTHYGDHLYIITLEGDVE